MTDSNNERTLGILLAKVENIESSLERAERKTDENRAVVHRRLDDMVTRVGSVEGDLRMVTNDIAEMRPVTDEVKKWKIMGMTAIAIVGLGGSALGVIFADTVRRILALAFAR